MNYLWLGLALPSYLLGAVPSALIAGKLLKGVDIRKSGSGNVGATNALRALGVGPSAMVFAADFAKGALPAYVGWQLSGSMVIGMVCALAAIVGHNWSVYIGFSGGKGVASSLGGLFVLLPLVAVVAAAVGIAVIALTRYVSLGSLTGAVLGLLVILAFAFSAGNPELAIYASIAAGLVIVQHRSNIGRLLAGKENRLFQRVGEHR